MAKDDGIIVGAIPKRTPEEQAMHDKKEHYRKKALNGDDALFDMECGVFLMHGKHPVLAGIDAVIAIDVPSFLAMLAGVIPTVLIPRLVMQVKPIGDEPTKGKPA